LYWDFGYGGDEPDLGARGVVLERRGDEEDELAPGDGRRKRGRVIEVGLEQHQTPGLRRAGD